MTDADWKRKQAEQTAQEMGKGGRLSLMSAWLAEGKVRAHGADTSGEGLRFHGSLCILSVGDVYFDDNRKDYPSERLVAMIALALQAGVDNTGFPPGVMPGDKYRDPFTGDLVMRPFK